MIDIKILRDNPQAIQLAAMNKGVSIDVTHIIEIDQKYRELMVAVQMLREERNSLVRAASSGTEKEKQAAIEEGRKLKVLLEQKEHAFASVKDELNTALLSIPNPAKPDVKVGKDDTENEVVRKVGDIPKFTFIPKHHLTLGEALDIIDVERAAKVSGSRFYYLKNEGVLLQFALRQLAFEVLLAEGFTPVLPPTLIKREIMQALGYMENGGDEDMYQIPSDNLILVGTSEQSVVPMHKDEVLNTKDLPLRYVAFSSCFRREAGSYGKDTRGILRAHQFDKIEMVSFVKEGEDDKEHEYLLSLEEKLLQMLNIPYQVVKMCTGDLGFPASRKYDLEGWIPSENKYRELTSTSTTGDFQARRLNTKYREGNETKYVQILNGTGFSTRPIIAILENNQQEDGSIVIPEVLRKYMGKDVIKAR